MGIRADFYIGKGKDAEWIGSIAYDGYRSEMLKNGKEKLNCGVPLSIRRSRSEDAFRKKVTAYIKSKDHGTLPEQGWPWPWKTSETSDHSFWFFNGKVWDDYTVWDGSQKCCWYINATIEKPTYEDEDGDRYAIDDPEDIKKFVADKVPIIFPDMSAKMNVTYGQRSGAMFIGA